jgi:hypothetical protein
MLKNLNTLGGLRVDLYERLVQSRNSLLNTYDDLLPAEQKATEVVKTVNEVLVQYIDGDETVKTGLTPVSDSIVSDFDKFFSEDLEATVPEPFYGTLAGCFINAKGIFRVNSLTPATKEAIRLWLHYGHPNDIIRSFNNFGFQTWLFELNVAEKDDFNTWMANLLVEVSHEIQDPKFNQVAKYVIDVLHLEAAREDEATGNGLYLYDFKLTTKPGGSPSTLVFNTRYFELDNSRGNASEVIEVQFGSESHTKHSGFFSGEEMYTTITIFLQDGSQFTRYQSMGSTEQNINAYRVNNQRAMEKLAAVYEVTSGGHGFSSSGYRMSYSIGHWF